jgi:NAD(P)H dehydrogenase (quinone)
MTIDIDYLTQ